MLDNLLNLLVVSIFATAIGIYLARKTKKVATEKQRYQLAMVIKCNLVGLLILMFILVRPHLPTEGVWGVFHTENEIAKSKEMKELQKQIEEITEAVTKSRQ